MSNFIDEKNHNSKKKLVTVCLLTYNEEKFVEDALHSVLYQTYSPLKVIVSDDCSTDSTFEVIKKVTKKYKGLNEIVLNRNERNMGINNHINYVVNNFIKTEYMVFFAGDDIGFQDKVSKSIEYFENNHDVFAVCCNPEMIDEKGNKLNKQFIDPNKFSTKKRDINSVLRYGTQYPGAGGGAWRREIFDIFGDLSNTVRNEDFIIPHRAAILGKIGYISEPLVYYRQHENNMSFWVKKRQANGVNELKELEISHLSNRLNNLIAVKKDLQQSNCFQKEEYLIKIERNIFDVRIRIGFLKSGFLEQLKYILKHKNHRKLHLVYLISPKLYFRLLA